MQLKQRADALQRLLRVHYGHESFRPHQLEGLAGTLAGQDVLLILPTGGPAGCLSAVLCQCFSQGSPSTF